MYDFFPLLLHNKSVVLNQGVTPHLYSETHLAMSGDMLGCHTVGLLLAWWVEARDAAINIPQPPGQLLTPTAKNYPAQDVNIVKIEKPCIRL